MSNEVAELKIGQRITCDMGVATVKGLLGSGGQASVYLVEINRRDYALKLLKENLCKPVVRNNILRIIKEDFGSAAFIKPISFVELGARFGCIMEIIPKHFYTCNSYCGGAKIPELGDEQIVLAPDQITRICINICDALRRLHSKQLVHKDISGENVMFNPDTAEVVVIDNDNVTPIGMGAQIWGTAEFMAPQLVSRKDRSRPNLQSENHSLAVLLFLMLVVEHPLKGLNYSRLAAKGLEESHILNEILSLDKARFIFERDDDSLIDRDDEAHVQAYERWCLYPAYIKRMFHRCFVDGIATPTLRPTAIQWEKELVRFLGCFYTCPHCGGLYVYDRDQFRNGSVPKCDDCGRWMEVARMCAEVDNEGEPKVITLTDGAKLPRILFDLDADDKFAPGIGARIRGGGIELENYSCDMTYRGRRIPTGASSVLIYSGDQIDINGKTYNVKL